MQAEEGEKENMGTAYKRAYLASCLRHYAQIPLWGTSDTVGTLYTFSFKEAKA